MVKVIVKYLVITAILLGLGYYLGRQKQQVVTVMEERVVYKEGAVKIKEQTVIREKIIRPDGTIEERLITKDKEVEELTKLLAKEKSKVKIITPVLSKYSLGLQTNLKKNELDTIGNISKADWLGSSQAVIGARLGDSGLWLEGLVSLDTRSFGLGVRYEW
jgi:uncharacterized protein HemX